MPLYDFKCENSNCEDFELVIEGIAKPDERNSRSCTKCGQDLKCLVSAGRFIPFKAGWYEHLDKDPIYIKNKRHLREECEKRGKGSVYLDDM